MATITQLPTAGNGGDEPMGPTVRRTRAGSEELVTQKRSLSDAQRKVLLYANGKRSMETLSQMIPAVAEHPDIITGMRDDGLIELVDPELGEVIDPGHGSGAGPATSTASESRSEPPSAPSGTDPSSEVLAAKNALRPEISRLLGDEGKAALERLETINESTELRTFVGKLVELVKLYAGKPASERFAAQFQKWL